MRLPNFPREQLILLDGIRHAAETIQFALTRLQDSLTDIALGQQSQSSTSIFSTPVFIDAWAVADAMHRFDTLYGMLTKQKKRGEAVIPELEEINLLRNVDQHLATRVQYVVAHSNTALGILSWLTVLPNAPDSMMSCMIRPGTAAPASWKLDINFPSAGEFIHPTFQVYLQSGQFRVELVSLAKIIAKKIAGLEEQIDKAIDAQGLRDQRCGIDQFSCVWLVPANEGQGT